MKKSGFTPTLILTSFRFLKTVFTNSNIFSKILLSHKSHSETKKQHQGWCRGFTLPELIMVIAIIGIVSGIVVASLNSARNKGGATVIRTQLAQVRNTMTQHYADFGFYPPLTATSPYNTGLPPTMGHIFQWYAVDGATPCATCFDAIVKNSFAAIKGQINTNTADNRNTIYYEINEKEPGKLGYTIGVFGRDGSFISITENSSKTLTSGVTGRAAGTQDNIAGAVSSISAAVAVVTIDETPTSLPFTDQTGVNITTLTLSNIIPIAGIDTVVAVSLSGDSSSEFRTCSNSNCATEVRTWGTNATTINPGQWLQLRLISSWGGSTAVSATITVGTLSRTWIVTTLLPFSATGGTVTTSGAFAIHTFTSDGTFTPNVSANVEVLMVGGGGSGGTYGGGGGGGGVAYAASQAVTPNTPYTITVGAGSIGTAAGVAASTGGSSTAFAQTVAGGGDAGRFNNIAPGIGANSGGRGAYQAETMTNGTIPTAASGYITYGGFKGGAFTPGGGGPYLSGGGAGAGGDGVTAATHAGNGGGGIVNAITGTSLYWAGGGGGATYGIGASGSAFGGNGGLGGGGGGAAHGSTGGTSSGSALNSGQNGNFSANNRGGNGGANTGGGGGGTSYEPTSGATPGGNGGSGIVIVRYPATSFVDLTRVALSTITPSNIIQISGISGSVPVSISGSGAQFRICTDSTCSSSPGSFVTSATITNNQFLQLQLTSSGSYATALSTIITVGGGTDTWSVTSRAQITATGGTITTSGGYTIHTFTTVGNTTFTVSGTGGSVDYLIVAGGGAGGNWHAGGGGAGGMRSATGLAVTAQAYTVTIGAGGAGGTSAVGSNGGDSSALGITSTGGGRGGNYNTTNPASGGSGAGGNATSVSGYNVAASGTSGQGTAGGNGNGDHAGGGGGGKGAAGSAAPNASTGGAGGVGQANSYSGASVTYAGGGGGGTWGGGAVATGGSGGGGNGSYNSNTNAPTPGSANTGGGGGGNGGQGNNTSWAAQTTGGSGIVIIRYIP